MTRVGFTGTQIGCSDHQIAAMTRVFVGLKMSVLHHGDCIGADEMAHYIARVMEVSVEKHPPIIQTKCARCEMLPGEITHSSRDYLVRNHDIVDLSTVLVATPKEEVGEEMRSGTWATVRYARKLRRTIYVIRPSGAVEKQEWPYGRAA